jgi:hypothetical protein
MPLLSTGLEESKKLKVKRQKTQHSEVLFLFTLAFNFLLRKRAGKVARPG